MKTLILIITVLTAAHFIYEAILLPTIRQSLRFRLFRARDELRMLKFEFPHQVSDSAFEYLDQAITMQMNYQHRLTVGLVATCELEYQRNPELSKLLKERLAKIERCELPAFKKMEQQSLTCFVLALGANCLFLFAPFVVLILISRALQRRITSVLKPLSVLNESDLTKVSYC